MRLLVVGGAGAVGSMTLPHMSEDHELTVFDVKQPAAGPWRYVAGDATDFSKLAAAAREADALIYMAMGPIAGWGEPDNVAHHFDVSVKGMYLALWAAAEAGVPRAVVTSSMSVYGDIADGPYPAEDLPPTATDFYGLTKRCGELVCEAAARDWKLKVVVLRLCLPTPDAEYPPQRPEAERAISTSARDTARALMAGLSYPGPGCEVFTISGDHRERYARIGKARRLLGWEPLDRISD